MLWAGIASNEYPQHMFPVEIKKYLPDTLFILSYV